MPPEILNPREAFTAIACQIRSQWVGHGRKCNEESEWTDGPDMSGYRPPADFLRERREVILGGQMSGINQSSHVYGTYVFVIGGIKCGLETVGGKRVSVSYGSEKE